MDYLPLHFDLTDRSVLVVGGGTVASRKVDLLLQAGARVRLVAPVVDDSLRQQLADGHEIIEAPYDRHYLEGVVLAVGATSDPVVNSRISGDAQEKSIPVNVVDEPALCTVVFPAIVDRSPVLLSIGSSGTSPVLSRYLRLLLEQILPDGISRLAQYLKGKRQWLKQTWPDVDQRRRITEQFMSSPGMNYASQGKFEAADDYLTDTDATIVQGEVYLVGGGPGDPDLLTLKALQLLQQADVILYDNLVSDKVLDRARRDAYKEFVGKRSGYQSMQQENINELLVRLAREGKRVLRLKGGDPFIFGRGGEEIEALVAERIPFQVVPGITAASGCAAYAGIPLTHRDHSQSVRFVTGHPKDGDVNLSWDELVSPNQTIVFYMGLGGLASICRHLTEHGLAVDTPVAVVSRGTTPEQKVIRGSLNTITDQVALAQVETPTLIIIGQVVGLYQD